MFHKILKSTYSQRSKRHYRNYGDWIQNPSPGPTSLTGRPGSTVFTDYTNEYDLHRPFYPNKMWDALEKYCKQSIFRTHADQRRHSHQTTYQVDGPKCQFNHALDIATGTGRGAIELAKRKQYRTVTAVDLDHGMLQQLESNAHVQGLVINTLHSPAEEIHNVPDGSIDLIVVLQAFHWFNREEALIEMRRVLNPETGTLLIAWNDRDLNIPWIQRLESILEECNPKYNRDLKQTEAITRNGTIFQPYFASAMAAENDGSDSTIQCEIYDNATPGMTTAGLIALMQTMSYVKNALNEKEMEQFENRVTEMCNECHGENATFEMPWLTKAFVLKPNFDSAFPLHIL